MSGRPKGDQHHIGLLNGFAAYGMWGLVPLFWPLLKPAGAAEILAHRMVWSLAFVAVALLVIRRWAWAGELLRQPRKLGLVTIAAAFITVNWGVYIWAVNSGHVVEASLGYFINPLVTIAMGVLLLKERLRPAQWAAVGVGLAAVLVLAVGYGRPPWISLTLAFSFATYGLVKKKVNLGGIESLAAETAIQFFPALAYLLWLNSHGTLTFAQEGAGHATLLASTGIVTALPSSASARRRSGSRCRPSACSSTWHRSSSSCWASCTSTSRCPRTLGGLRPGVAGPGPADDGRVANGPPGQGHGGGATTEQRGDDPGGPGRHHDPGGHGRGRGIAPRRAAPVPE